MSINIDKSLLEILRSFSETEWREFGKFCNSPYHNNGRNFTPLLKILGRFRPEFDSTKLSKEYIYRSLYPGRSFKLGAVNSMLSRLNLLTESFLVQCGLRENRYMTRERLLLNQLSSRRLTRRSEKLISMAESEMLSEKLNPFDYSSWKDMYAEISSFYSVNNERKKHFESISKCLKQIIYSFLSEVTYFRAAEISAQGPVISARQDTFSAQCVKLIPLEMILKEVEKEDTQNFRFLRIYQLLLIAFECADLPENYFRYKKAVYDDMDKMSDSMKRFLLNTLSVLSNYYLVAGNSGFRRESFEIRKKTVSEGVFAFSESGYPKISEFRSAFIDALNQKEIDWAEEFCNKFIDTIHPEQRDELRYYYSSRLCYERGRLDEALKLASRVNINQTAFKLDMKNLLAKIYYDTESHESLRSLIDTYLKTTGISGKRATMLQIRHRKFASYLKKLLILKERRSGISKIEFLKGKFEKENFTSKSWLTERADDLIRSMSDQQEP